MQKGELTEFTSLQSEEDEILQEEDMEMISLESHDPRQKLFADEHEDESQGTEADGEDQPLATSLLTDLLNWYLPRRIVALALLFVAEFICYLDRTNISVAIIPMTKQFEWDNKTKGWILSSFFYGYLLTQIPGGWLAAVFGGKVGVVAWSLFTILTPISSPIIWTLLICRMLMGAGEGVTFPAIHDLAAHWFPVAERSRSMAFMTSGQETGTVAAMLIAPLIATVMGWEYIFYFFGGFGFLWFGLYQVAVTSTPETHPLISQKELHFIQRNRAKLDEKVSPSQVPWKELFSSTAVWAIIVAHFCFNFGWYLVLSWLPSFFSETLKVPLEDLGWFTVLPFLVMIVGTNTGGLIADFLIKRQILKIEGTRKLLNTIGLLGPAVSFILMIKVRFSILFPTFFACAGLGLASLSRAGYWVNHIDIAPKYSGVLMGITNTFATMAGIIVNLFTGYVLQDSQGDWDLVFFTVGAVYFFGAVFFALFARGEILFGAAHEKEEESDDSIDAIE